MFKITGGVFRGTKLDRPPESLTRPTSTRTREALFSCLFSLDYQMNDLTVIDGFAGSGIIGLECLSRGARFCTFVENNPIVQEILKANIAKLQMRKQTTVLSTFKQVKKPADFIFLDAPYFQKERNDPSYLQALKKLRPYIRMETLVVIETDKKEKPLLDFLEFLFEKNYGTAKLSFYKLSTLEKQL